MRILFVRHAEAVDREAFDGPDLQRPLTRTGAKDARSAYRLLARMVEPPQLVISSEALRATQTAEILCNSFALKTSHMVRSVLNPGCTALALQRLLKRLPRQTERIALVGHEPDFSVIVSSLSGGPIDAIKIGKGTCVELLLRPGEMAQVRAVIPFKWLAAAGRR